MVMKYTVAWRFLFGDVSLGVFLLPCGTVQVCRLVSEYEKCYLILGLPGLQTLCPLVKVQEQKMLLLMIDFNSVLYADEGQLSRIEN